MLITILFSLFFISYLIHSSFHFCCSYSLLFLLPFLSYPKHFSFLSFSSYSLLFFIPFLSYLKHYSFLFYSSFPSYLISTIPFHWFSFFPSYLIPSISFIFLSFQHFIPLITRSVPFCSVPGIPVLVSYLLFHLCICECLQEGWPLFRLTLGTERDLHTRQGWFTVEWGKGIGWR